MGENRLEAGSARRRAANGKRTADFLGDWLQTEPLGRAAVGGERPFVAVVRVRGLPVCDIGHVLVTTAGKVDDEDGLAGQSRRNADGLGEGVGRFERGDDAFATAERVEGVDGVAVVADGVTGAVQVG